MRKFLPYGRQFLGTREYRAVRRILQSPRLTQGPCVPLFENLLKEATGAPYALAVANGSIALNLAVAALKLHYGLPDGSLALTTPNTFVSSSNALLHNRLQPLFCDICPETLNLSLEKLEFLLEKYQDSIALLLPVHFAGEPVDMPKLQELAQKYGRLPIIEDAAHAIGSGHNATEKVGSCQYSDACCFSFHPVKTITTAEGGAITCRDPELYKLLLSLRNHGREQEDMQLLGHNARLSEIHAALGLAQLGRLDGFVRRRRQLAARYNLAFRSLDWLRPPPIGPYTCPHIYVAQMDFRFLRRSRSELRQQLLALGIGTQVHYLPVPQQTFYRQLGYDMTGLEQTQNYYCKALTLPLYPALKFREQARVIRAICRL